MILIYIYAKTMHLYRSVAQVLYTLFVRKSRGKHKKAVKTTKNLDRDDVRWYNFLYRCSQKNIKRRRIG